MLGASDGMPDGKALGAALGEPAGNSDVKLVGAKLDETMLG